MKIESIEKDIAGIKDNVEKVVTEIKDNIEKVTTEIKWDYKQSQIARELRDKELFGKIDELKDLIYNHFMGDKK